MSPVPDELVLIPLGRIRPGEHNPRRRIGEDGLRELAESIGAQGVLQPILVRPVGGAVPSYEIVAGERRWRAAGIAGLSAIPAIVRQLSDRECLEVAVAENDQREDVSPLERAEGYRRLVEDHGVSVEDLAARIGKSVSAVRGLLKLCQLPEQARKALDAGELSPAVAGLVARVPGEKLREELAALACREDWQGQRPSYRAVKEAVGRRLVELKGCGWRLDDEDLPGGPCRACPKRVGNLAAEDPEAWQGARADMCTDPECYGEKAKAHAARLLADAAAGGQKVLPAKEAEKLYPHGSHLAYGAAYVDLDERCEGAKGDRTYRQVIGAKAVPTKEVVIALDRGGRAHQLLPRKRAAELLAAKGVTVTQYTGNGRAVPTTDGERKEAARKREEGKAKLAAEREALSRGRLAAEKLFAALPQDHAPTNQVLRVLCRELIDSNKEHQESVVRARGLTFSGTQEREQRLAEIVTAGGAAKLLGLAAELLLASRWRGTWRGSRDDLGALCGALGVPEKRVLEKQTADKLRADKKLKGMLDAADQVAKRQAAANREIDRRLKAEKKREATEPPVSPQALDEQTWLIDLVAGADVSKAGAGLEEAGLRTVRDLLRRCCQGDVKGPPLQRPYNVLRGVKGLSAKAVLEIGDAIVEAGLHEQDGRLVLPCPAHRPPPAAPTIALEEVCQLHQPATGPACFCCGRAGQPAQYGVADAAEDLVPVAELPPATREHLRLMPRGTGAGVLVCLGCVDACRPKGSRPRKRKGVAP